MATKKAATAAAQPTKQSKTTAMTVWQEEMAKAARAAAKENPVTEYTAARISTRGGVFTIDKENVGTELDLVVIGAIWENGLYDGAYDPDHPRVPVCYAFSNPDMEDPEEEMRPHESAENPQGGAGGGCSGCEHNEFGSAATGRGKACKNTRRLALLTPDALESAEAIREAEVRSMSVPVMSVASWSKFVQKVSDDFERPYWCVVVKAQLVPDPKSQFKVTFTFVELIDLDSEKFKALQEKHQEAIGMLSQPYPAQEELDARAAARKPVVPKGKLASKLAAGGKAAGGKAAGGKATPTKGRKF